MPEAKPAQSPKEDDAMLSIMGLGFLFLAGYGLYRLMNRQRPSVEQRHLSGMEQEIARLYAEGYDL